MTINPLSPERCPPTHPVTGSDRGEAGATALTAMLEARSVALVGASRRPGSLGERMVAQVAASPSRPRLYPVNPRYREVGGLRCHPCLADLPEPVDLVLLAVPDTALEEQLAVAASRGDRSAVIFGSAFDVPGRPPGLRGRLAAIASSTGMALCGAGCMGFVNMARGLRAVGYVEPAVLPAGPVALVTHSGSVFSTLLRGRRGFGFSVAVSSGQELVTSAAAYAGYALGLPETRVLALVLEAIRDAGLLRAVLADAERADVPVVLLAVGGSEGGGPLVAAHSGALAAGDGAWQALADAHGLHRVGDLAEMADTLELFAARRWRTSPPPKPSPAPGQASGGTSGPKPGAAPTASAAAEPPRPEPAAGSAPVVSGPGRSARDVSGPDGGSRSGSDSDAGGSGPDGGEVSGAGSGRGIATVHDSGLERAHVADLAGQLGVPFAVLGTPTLGRLAAVLDPGLESANPLDLWGTGRDAERQFTECLTAMADDPAVVAVALAVDLVPEFDGDDSYQRALLATAARTSKPLVVLAGLPASIDPAAATRLRAVGIPVLEGTRTGLLALRHLLDHTLRRPASALSAREANNVPPARVRGANDVPPARVRGANDIVEQHRCHTDAVRQRQAGADGGRAARWRAALAAGPLDGAASFGVLRDYGIPAAEVRAATSCEAALAAADEIGYPVVLKTDEPGVAHKSDAGGVLLGLDRPAVLAAAYRDLATRLGPRVLVCQAVPPGTEILLGITRDPALGPLIVVGAGGVLAELLADRVVALLPVDRVGALAMLRRLRAFALLSGARGQPPADLASIADAITGLSALACELGDALDALDINPLICGPSGALAVDGTNSWPDR